MNTVLYGECSLCGEEYEFELNEQETETYKNYLVLGRSMGMIQDLFPRVPAWIRSGSIDKAANGFCICPKCSDVEAYVES